MQTWHKPKQTPEGGWKTKAYWLLMAALLAVFLYSGTRFLTTWFSLQKDKDEFAALAEVGLPEETSAGEAAVQADPLEALLGQDHIAALAALNPDCVGWLYVPGTRISYPVMDRPGSEQYYLRRNFKAERSESGTPFVGVGGPLGSTSSIIYGHNMNNGSMFADVVKYKDQGYWQEHQTVYLGTAEGILEYEVIAAFATQIPLDDDTAAYRYYTQVGNLGEEAYKTLVRSSQSLTSYDTALAAAYPQRLLMLSTCSYHTEEGRFVLLCAEKAAQG